jgi:sigma-B regulation protein RsbU (phosphoserine phosphatase)
VREAASGHVASLIGGGAAVPVGQSIVSLDIHSAICAPILLDASVVAFLYLDSRGAEPAGARDAGGFCQAVSRLAGLALSNLKREELVRRQRQLEGELMAAREAQEFLLPESSGTIGHLRYVLDTRPGRVVAGDLFDVFAIDDDRVAVCCGDVAGQGVGAGILMTAVLSLLRGAVPRFADPAGAVSEVNRAIAERTPDDRFVSLWIGVFDRTCGEVRYVDAGHGHWLVKRTGAEPVRPEGGGGLLVGIDPRFAYVSDTFSLDPGDRVVVYSDGVVEHRSASGEEFGSRRLIGLVAGSNRPESDVEETMKALIAFIGGMSLKDDTTIASIEVRS